VPSNPPETEKIKNPSHERKNNCAVKSERVGRRADDMRKWGRLRGGPRPANGQLGV